RRKTRPAARRRPPDARCPVAGRLLFRSRPPAPLSWSGGFRLGANDADQFFIAPGWRPALRWRELPALPPAFSRKGALSTPDKPGHGFRPRAHVKFFINLPHISIDRPHTDAEFFGDFLGSMPLGQQP